MQTKISSDIWEDPDFIELDDGEKLVFFWLLTNCNQAGFIEVTERKMNRDIGSPYEKLEGLMKGLPRAFVKIEKTVWIRNYIGRQIGRGSSLASNNITKCVVKHVSTMCEQWVEIVADEYPELADMIDTRLVKKEKPLASPCQGQGVGVGEGVGTGEGKGVGVGAGKGGRKTGLSELQLRLGRMFNYSDSRKWDAAENRAWNQAKELAEQLTEEELQTLEALYASSYEYKRRNLATLLNNLNGEVDKAKKEVKGITANTPPDKPVLIPDGSDGWWTVMKGKMIRENKHEQRTVEPAHEEDIKRYREKTGREPIQ